MGSAKKLFNSFKSSNGRIKVATLLGVSSLVAALALLVGMVPAVAGAGGPTAGGAEPAEIDQGGGSGACDFGDEADSVPGLPSAAEYELHINNPIAGTYTGPDGTEIEIYNVVDDQFFSFRILNNPSMAVYDVVVNGGSKSIHFDYDNGLGAERSDEGLHAPTKGGSGNLYGLSHVNFCYDVNPVADLGVTKNVEGGAALWDVGDIIEFTVVVVNDGPLDATGVTVVDTLPRDGENNLLLDFDDTDTRNAGWVESPSGTLTYQIGNLAVADSPETLSLFLTVTPYAAGASGDDAVKNSVSVSGDQDDPDEGTPNSDNTAGSVPPVTVTADVSGIKYHDRDTDGSEDPTEEEGLSGFTIAALDAQGNVVLDSGGSLATATTGADGSYTIANLIPGDYTICEANNTTAGLPDDGTGFVWSWTQSEPTGNTLCSGFPGYEPAGYSVTVDGDIGDIDFGNHIQVAIDCRNSDVVVVLGGPFDDDNPLSTVTIPQGTASCASDASPFVPWTTTYDVGRSEDNDSWSQFVVFGGFPLTGDATEFKQDIVWDAEEGTYVNSSGATCVAGTQGCSLLVPTTQVNLFPGGTLAPVTFCGDGTAPGLADTDGDGVGNPTPAESHCLADRVIAEGAPLANGFVQLTEHYRFLGDPGRFR